ncbi:MAG: hypothetical protein KDD73_15555 [Anaerolineales bacterium]|nr:hypothetical protein [Anaerolineales bacterium]MCP5230913.1 hypothetical protein [Zoogloeaceae bacterium]
MPVVLLFLRRFWPQLLAAGVALAAAWWLHHLGYQAGAAAVQAKWEVERKQLEDDHDKEVARLNAAARYMDVRFIETVREVEGKTRTIVKEVPRYVTVENDRACPVPDGFVRVYDAAIRQDSLPPDPAAAGVDGAPTGIALSDVARNAAENYGVCHQYAARVAALQDYLRQIAARGGNDG